jgi:hypothetical protein
MDGSMIDNSTKYGIDFSTKVGIAEHKRHMLRAV